MKLGDKAQSTLILVAAAGAALWYFWPSIKNALVATGDAINPLSQTNIFYKAASEVATKITGDDRPLGVQLWEWLNPSAVELEQRAIYGVPAPPAPVISDAVFQAWYAATGGFVPAGQNQTDAIVAWLAVQPAGYDYNPSDYDWVTTSEPEYPPDTSP